MHTKIALISLIFGTCVFSESIWATDISLLALFHNKALVSIDGKKKVIKQDVETPEGVLLISTDNQAKEAMILVDGTQKKYTLGTPTYSSGYAKSKQGKVVQIVKNNSGMYTTVGSINGQTVNFLVDTGASQVAMNAIQAKRLGLQFRYKGKKTLVQTASGVAKAYAIKLNRVKIGNIELTNVDAMVLNGTSPTEVLLGMSFLGRLKVTHEGNRMHIKKKF